VLEDLKASEESKTKQVLAPELRGLLHIIFVLAEHYGIKLEEAFLETMSDYILRFIK